MTDISPDPLAAGTDASAHAPAPAPAPAPDSPQPSHPLTPS